METMGALAVGMDDDAQAVVQDEFLVGNVDVVEFDGERRGRGRQARRGRD